MWGAGMSEWIETTVGELAASTRNALVGGPFGSNLVSKDYVDDGVPVIRGQNMGGRWVAGDFAYVSPEKAQALAANAARPGDIVFTQRGTLGQVALVPKDSFKAYVVSQSQMKLTVDPNKADSLFLYYLFSSPVQQEYIRQNAIQVGVPHTNLGILRDAPVCIPKDVDAQRAIARYLGSLDDKIELNRRMNETLEAMARAIFQSWFVDFDPVRAKASGESADSICQRLCLTPELLALFPDSFEDSELGEIPKGWPSTRMDEVLELAYGKALKARDRIDGAFPVYGSGGVTGCHNEALIDGPAIIVGRKGTVGSLYWADRSSYPIDTVFYVKPKMQLTYCFYLLKTLALETMNTDAAVPGLNRNNVYRLLVSMPSEEVRAAFERLAISVRSQICANTKELKTLSDVRDTLLPKLLSGEFVVAMQEDLS